MTTGRDATSTQPPRTASLQFDVAADGQPDAQGAPAGGCIGGEPALDRGPPGRAQRLCDRRHYGKVRQFAIGAGGALAPRRPRLPARRSRHARHGGEPERNGSYVLVAGGIAVFDIDAQGALTRRPGLVEVASCELEDIVLTPDGRHMYATLARRAGVRLPGGRRRLPRAEGPAQRGHARPEADRHRDGPGRRQLCTWPPGVAGPAPRACSRSASARAACSPRATPSSCRRRRPSSGT